jgi:hypothetical protein
VPFHLPAPAWPGPGGGTPRALVQHGRPARLGEGGDPSLAERTSLSARSQGASRRQEAPATFPGGPARSDDCLSLGGNTGGGLRGRQGRRHPPRRRANQLPQVRRGSHPRRGVPEGGLATRPRDHVGGSRRGTAEACHGRLGLRGQPPRGPILRRFGRAGGPDPPLQLWLVPPARPARSPHPGARRPTQGPLRGNRVHPQGSSSAPGGVGEGRDPR